MRSCAHAEQARQAVVAELPFDDDLRAHVAACPVCARIAARARRFESRLDTAMGELVTDALPPGTATIARSAPPATRRRRPPRVLAGAMLGAAVVGFAAVGAVVTGSGLTDAFLGGRNEEVAPSAAAIETVDCYLGEPTGIVVDGVPPGDPSAVRVAYCFGDAADTVSVGGAISCVRAFDADARIGPRKGDDRSYLGACTRVQEAGSTMTSEESLVTPGPPRPFTTWADAVAAVDWPLREPTWLPDGYGLTALQGFASADAPDMTASVIAMYLRNGVPLILEEFAIADPDGFQVELSLPNGGVRSVTTGQTTVDGNPAFWASGVDVETGAAPAQRVQAMVLAWRDDAVGYRITARELDLEAVRRIAASISQEEARRSEGEAAMLEERARRARP